MRRKTVLRLSEHNERGEVIREVSISASQAVAIAAFMEELVEPALLAWGYHPVTVSGVFREE